MIQSVKILTCDNQEVVLERPVATMCPLLKQAIENAEAFPSYTEQDFRFPVSYTKIMVDWIMEFIEHHFTNPMVRFDKNKTDKELEIERVIWCADQNLKLGKRFFNTKSNECIEGVPLTYKYNEYSATSIAWNKAAFARIPDAEIVDYFNAVQFFGAEYTQNAPFSYQNLPCDAGEPNLKNVMFDRFIQEISERAEAICDSEATDKPDAFRKMVFGLEGKRPLPFEMLTEEKRKEQTANFCVYFES